MRVRVRVRVRVRIRVRVRVRVKNTAGGGGLVWPVWFRFFWFALVWNDDVCIKRARSAHHATGQRHTGVR